MATFLIKRPPGPEDTGHGVKKAFMVPLTEAAGPFHERFGIDVYTIFNMTEISSPIVSEPNPVKLGTCGKVRAAWMCGWSMPMIAKCRWARWAR